MTGNAAIIWVTRGSGQSVAGELRARSGAHAIGRTDARLSAASASRTPLDHGIIELKKAKGSRTDPPPRIALPAFPCARPCSAVRMAPMPCNRSG